MPEKVYAILPAAGQGQRVGAAVPKQYLSLAGRPMLARSVQAVLAAEWIDLLVVVVAPDDEQRAREILGDWPRVSVRAIGGATRCDSVLAGVESLDADEQDWILVHDAARPGLPATDLAALRAAAADDPVGALLALPVADTLKRAGDGLPARARATLDRTGLWAAQTPQMFRAGLLRAALRACPGATDEAAAIEAAGHCPRLVAGHRDNFKVTGPGDLDAMSALLAAREPDGGPHPAAPPRRDAARVPVVPYRIGQGYDIHALVPGRPLVLGGVTIPSARGLLGHSDADALLHAVTDALLGAAALGDIGRHFPDTDPRLRGADSSVLLAEAARMAYELGWQVGNVDASIIAQAPRLAPFVPAMCERIAEVLAVAPERVNVKARTGERLGPVGRGECIEAQASVLLVHASNVESRRS